MEKPVAFQLRTLQIVHQWLRQAVQAGDVVLDATVGNGHDTAFLADLVGPTGRVYGLDLQAEAVERTLEALQDKGCTAQCEIKATCHSQLSSFLGEEHHGTLSAVMFNLGYLPRGDKSIITQTQTTIPALEQSLPLLKIGGIMTIMCYPGHEGGASEASEVESWCAQLTSPDYLVMRMSPHNPKNPAPFLLAVQKSR